LQAKPAEFARLTKPKTLRAHADAVVREMLLGGRLAPGQRINEVELSGELDISRGILREALRGLEQDGLVVSTPHRGVFVRLLTPAEAGDISEVRLALETTAALRIARGPVEPAIEILEARYAELVRLIGEPYAIRTRADLAFHEAVCECSANDALLRSWRGLMGSYVAMLLSVTPSPYTLVDPERHRPLLDAINSRDEVVIEKAWRDHFASGVAYIVEHMRKHQ
jgi:DNA-binding GntR family transcriptional regulator